MSTKINLGEFKLNRQLAVGTFAECLLRKDIKGPFDNFKYAVSRNCRHVLLGHHDLFREAVHKVSMTTLEETNQVFIMNEEGKFRSPATWEELRAYLKDGWFMGTKKTPGIKTTFIESRKNHRHDASHILVFFSKP